MTGGIEDDDDRTRIRPKTSPLAEPASPLAPGAQDHGNGLPVGTRLAEFEISALLGEGGFGIVYLATDHSLQRRVALKEYMPSALAARGGGSQVQVKSQRYRETFDAGLKSFVNEARLLAKFDHPALVKVYRFWEANGTAYMVMPYYDGVTLKELLRTLPKPPDEPWLRAMLTPLTGALEVIHADLCFHRDIAPDNVMMLGGSHDRPLLLDFGAARLVVGDMTQALTVILKPGYAPVEQYAEIPGMQQGAWTDVYALAAVVYYAIMGKTPPPAVGRLLKDTYEPLVQAAKGRYSRQFLSAIDRALGVRPEERTRTIHDLSADLGLGQAQFDVYSTRPMPIDELDPSDHETAPWNAPAMPPSAASQMPQVATRAAGTAGASAKRAPVPPLVWAGGAVLVVGGLAFAAYQWLTPAPVAPPAAQTPAPNVTPAATTAAASPPEVAASSAPVATPTTAATVPTQLDVATEFERVVQAATPGFSVRAETPKPTLRIGSDQIRFSVQSERAGFLYVLGYSSDGSLLQIYPNTESGSIRVVAAKTLDLPKKGAIVFNVTEPPGPVRLLVIVSTRQREFAELDPRPEGAFRTIATGESAVRIAQAHRGPRPLLAGQSVCPTGQDCQDEFGAAVVTIDTVR
jgi:serine/threonine protein kinase